MTVIRNTVRVTLILVGSVDSRLPLASFLSTGSVPAFSRRGWPFFLTEMGLELQFWLWCFHAIILLYRKIVLYFLECLDISPNV